MTRLDIDTPSEASIMKLAVDSDATYQNTTIQFDPVKNKFYCFLAINPNVDKQKAFGYTYRQNYDFILTVVTFVESVNEYARENKQEDKDIHYLMARYQEQLIDANATHNEKGNIDMNSVTVISEIFQNNYNILCSIYDSYVQLRSAYSQLPSRN